MVESVISTNFPNKEEDGQTEYNLKEAEVSLHHFSLIFPKENIRTQFPDIRFIFVAGCPNRAYNLGLFLTETLFNGTIKAKLPLKRLTYENSRFDLYKIGPVLIADHGMGSASMSIAMHELLIMCQLAGVINKVTVVRFGTCGGIGVEEGSLCVTTKSYDAFFRDYIDIPICGKLVRRPCVIDQQTAAIMIRLGNELTKSDGLIVHSGATISTNDFYEEQARTNGAICDHTKEDAIQYLESAENKGVINFEMEANCLASMCHKLCVKFAIVCIAMSNRLSKNPTPMNKEQAPSYIFRLFKLCAKFIETKMNDENDNTFSVEKVVDNNDSTSLT